MIKITYGKKQKQQTINVKEPLAVKEAISVLKKVDFVDSVSLVAIINCPMFFSVYAGQQNLRGMLFHIVLYLVIFFYVKRSARIIGEKLKYIETLSKAMPVKNRFGE